MEFSIIFNHFQSFSIILLSLLLRFTGCQLVVNVRNNGGDVYRETIDANTTLDSIWLEFRKSDGTIITHFIDGRNEVQLFRAVILPEEDLGQTDIQTMCFLLRFTKNEFISSDAMSKLRQKNPSTIRHPEEVRSSEVFEMDVLLNVAASHVVSSHIGQLCSDAVAMTYARSSDLRLLAQILNRDYSILQTITRPAPTANLTSCSSMQLGSRRPCICHYDICVGWYPCGLKYCRGKDSAGRIVSYRCGIKTCSKCRQFEFLVNSKFSCVWDEAEFQPFAVDSDSLPRFDDAGESHGWKDEELLAPHAAARPVENVLLKSDTRNFLVPGPGDGSLVNGVKVENRVVKTFNQDQQGLRQRQQKDLPGVVKSTARDDDEDDE